MWRPAVRYRYVGQRTGLTVKGQQKFVTGCNFFVMNCASNGTKLWKTLPIRLLIDAVAVAGRLADDEDSHGALAAVDGLVGLAGGDLDALAGFEGEVVVLDLEGELALEDEEELPGADVVVAGLAGAGRHGLFDDVEVGGADEVPAVAVVSPGVVLGVGGGDGLGRHKDRV